MAAQFFLRLVNGAINVIAGKQVSAGAGDAGAIVALDDTGRIDNSMMPVGIGADTKAIIASEALAAGDWVNVWNNASAFNARKADATTPGKRTHGFVLAAVANGASATVHFEGTNTQVTGQTPGDVYLQTTAGAGGATIPSGAGQVVQKIGVAVSATEVNFEPSDPINLP